MSTTTISRILLIEDDLDDSYLFTEALKDSFQPITFDHVTDFLEAAHYLIHTKPDIIFLDLNLPYKNGFVILAELKADEVFKQIPVIVFSSSDNPKEIKQAYEKGAALFITKPIVFQELVLILQQVLRKDWNRPAVITADYFIDGSYKAFKAEIV